MAKGKLVLGVDIGSTAVKMILLKEQRRRGQIGYALQSFGMKPLPPEAIVDGALMNSTAIVQAIQELMVELKVKTRDAAIGVSGHSVIIKKISMPRMTQEELEESIQWEAEQYIPFDVKDVNIDTQILNSDANDATGQMDVLLVAAKKDMINDYTAVVAEAGLTPVVVDVDAFAVQNMFSVNYDLPENETVVLINAGASVVNINIISNGITVFTRDVTIGGNQFTEEIQKQLNVSYEEAEALKIGGGSNDADAVVPQDVERVMSSVAEQVAGEIQRSLDFYAGTAVDANFTRVYLSGGTAKIPALFKTIESRVGVPVEILNPFKNVEIDNRKFDPAFIMDMAPSAAVALGLGLRRPGDKFEQKDAEPNSIRINLLPVRAVKKREAGRQMLVLFAAMLLLGVIGNWYWYDGRETVRQTSADRVAATQARIKELEKVIGEVNNINKRKLEVEEKLKVLEELRKGRSGPVRLLDALATATPKKVWITGFDEKSNAVKLTGRAVSHEEVAEFMRGLQNVVWTTKGMGRVVERKKDSQTRVELIVEGSIEDFTAADFGYFFKDITLKRAVQSDPGKDDPMLGINKLVDFELSLSANYAI